MEEDLNLILQEDVSLVLKLDNLMKEYMTLLEKPEFEKGILEQKKDQFLMLHNDITLVFLSLKKYV
jgi:hypothetical protein